MHTNLFGTQARTIAIGVLAGTLGTAAMTRTQTLLEEHSAPPGSPAEAPVPPETPPVRTAMKLSVLLQHRSLDDAQKPRAAEIVTYAGGALIGGSYAALRAYAPPVTAASGLAFGAALWLVGDEVIGPLAGVADSPAVTPPQLQLIDLCAHLVFAATVELLIKTVGEAR